MTAEFEGSIGEAIAPAIDLETALFIDQHVYERGKPTEGGE